MIEVKRSPERARTVLAQKKAEAEARAEDHIAILRTATAQRRHQAVADALQRILVRGSQFMFERASELFAPQPWAVSNSGELLGHVLTVSDAVFDVVVEDCLVELLTLPDAFERSWADLEQRSAWVSAYAHALRAMAEREEREDHAVRERHRLNRELEPAPPGPARTGPLI